MQHPSSSRAFTLAQTLVTVAIIGSVAALLVPAIKQAGEQSRQAASVAQIRQLASLHLLYASEHGRMLHYRGWPHSRVSGGQPWPKVLAELYQLSLRDFLAPRALNPALREHDGKVAQWTFVSYGYNWMHLGSSWRYGKKPDPPLDGPSAEMTSLKAPYRTILLAEARHVAGGDEGPDRRLGAYILPDSDSGGVRQPGGWFHGKITVAWGDGHVTTLFYDEKNPYDILPPEFWKRDGGVH